MAPSAEAAVYRRRNGQPLRHEPCNHDKIRYKVSLLSPRLLMNDAVGVLR
jgi:hypothetical protein